MAHTQTINEGFQINAFQTNAFQATPTSVPVTHARVVKPRPENRTVRVKADRRTIMVYPKPLAGGS